MRILVADDHELVRRGICSLLATEPSLTVCGEAINGRDAVEKAAALNPDVVIMDISMPNLNGIEATREIKRSLPNSEVVIVSQHSAPEMVRQAFNAGARGYVVKSSISRDLIEAIGKVKHQELFVKVEGIVGTKENLDPQEVLRQSAAFEKALRESEERFRSATTSMAEGLYIVGVGGLTTYINPAAEKMLGWNLSELAGKRMHDVVHYKHPDGTPFPAEECPGLKVLEHGAELRDYEDIFIRRDGSFFPVLLSASLLKSDGKPAGVVVCFRDDTKRRQTQDDLQRSERIYRAVGESLDFGAWICDAQGKNIYASPMFLKLIGMTQEECSAGGWMSSLHPDDLASTEAAWKECVRTGGVWEREHRYRGADGHWHHVLARGVPVRDPAGKITSWAGIHLDTQRRREAENNVRQLVETLEERIAERSKELDSVSDKLRELSGRLLRTQDEERRRIARELHDGVGQLVSAMGMNIVSVESEKAALSPVGQQALDANSRLIEQAGKEIRTMSHLLHPPLLDEVGLESALRWYVDGFAERSKDLGGIAIGAGIQPGNVAGSFAVAFPNRAGMPDEYSPAFGESDGFRGHPTHAG